MSNNGLSESELRLSGIVDGSKNPVEDVIKFTQEIKREKAEVKRGSKDKRVKLGTEIALGGVKDSVKFKQLKDLIEFESSRDMMFQLTESSVEFMNMFDTKLTKEQQIAVVNYFYDGLEENSIEIFEGEIQFSSSQDLRVAKHLKGYLYLYYEGINERLAFIKGNKLPFMGNEYLIAERGEQIETSLTKYGTKFSSEGERIDIAFENKLEELESKTK